MAVKVEGHYGFGIRRETPRRYAPMGGSLHVEWVATLSGLRTMEVNFESWVYF